jgi:hypothetical protein
MRNARGIYINGRGGEESPGALPAEGMPRTVTQRIPIGKGRRNARGNGAPADEAPRPPPVEGILATQNVIRGNVAVMPKVPRLAMKPPNDCLLKGFGPF